MRGRESHRESRRTALSKAVQVLRYLQGPLGGPPPSNLRISLSQFGFQPLPGCSDAGEVREPSWGLAIPGEQNQPSDALLDGQEAVQTDHPPNPLHLSSESLFDMGPIIG